MSNEEKAVAVVKTEVAMTTRGVQLTSIDDAWRFCEAIARTEMVPKSMRGKPAEVFAVVQAGAEMGVTPIRALANMKIINGRVGPMGALAKAKVREANVLEPGTGFKEVFTGEEFEDDFTAHFTTMRKGESEVRTNTFSVADAKRAGLWGGKSDAWQKYPKRMLMWRAIGFHMDDYYSDILMGLHIAEVLDDYPAERIAATMEPLDTPAADPLLDQAQAERDAEIAEAEQGIVDIDVAESDLDPVNPANAIPEGATLEVIEGADAEQIDEAARKKEAAARTMPTGEESINRAEADASQAVKEIDAELAAEKVYERCEFTDPETGVRCVLSTTDGHETHVPEPDDPAGNDPDPADEEAGPTVSAEKIGRAPSPLSATMDAMSEKEALEDLKAEGEDVSDEAIAAAEPGEDDPERTEPELPL